MEQYNKLVRDKVPGIISSSGHTPHIKTLNDEEFLKALGEKLVEEAKEFMDSGKIEELADVAEVLHAILDARKFDRNEFVKIRESKKAKKGAFDLRLFLEKVE